VARPAPKKFVFNRRQPDLPSDLSPVGLFDHIESTELDHVNLADRTFASIVWKDVRLVSCDLANLETRHLTLVRVEFIDCRMTGLRAGVADCQDVLISEGDQRYSQFRYSKFRSTEFDSCNFEDADFQGTDLSGSIFRKCNLKNAEMSKVKLLNADLRGSQIEGLHLNAEDIRGAVVDLPQAMIFAGLLGIRIE
jgi:uncharacterized protein YjbI with pentapeptide repeats